MCGERGTSWRTRRSASHVARFHFLAVLALAGCGTGYPIGAEHAKPIVLVDAERDLDCPQQDIRVEEGWGGRFEAIGCGRKASYTANCVGIRCEVHRGDDIPVPAADRPTMDQVPR